MIDFQETISAQMKQFSEFQKDAAEKLQAKGTANVETWEKFTRHNLAVMGDVVDYTVKQSRLATSVSEPAEFFGKRFDNIAEFTKVLEGRTREFVDLWTETVTAASEEVQEATKKTVVKAVKKSA